MHVVSYLSDGALVGQDDVVALVHARLAASGRDFTFPLRAGLDTAARDYDDGGVRELVRHQRAPISRTVHAVAHPGYRYEGTFALPGRYYLDGVGIERAPGAGELRLADVSFYDAVGGRATVASSSARYLSDQSRFREAAVTPSIRLFEVPASAGRARVVAKVRLMPDSRAVLSTLRGQGTPIDPMKEALLTEADAAGATLPADARASKADVVRLEPGLVEVRAEGPGLLVVAESWDAGWTVQLDGRRRRSCAPTTRRWRSRWRRDCTGRSCATGRRACGRAWPSVPWARSCCSAPGFTPVSTGAPKRGLTPVTAGPKAPGPAFKGLFMDDSDVLGSPGFF